MKRKLLALPEHLSSPSVFPGFVLLDLVFSVWYFVDHYFSSSTFSFAVLLRVMASGDLFVIFKLFW
jgi:hypothetical protein